MTITLIQRDGETQVGIEVQLDENDINIISKWMTRGESDETIMKSLAVINMEEICKAESLLPKTQKNAILHLASMTFNEALEQLRTKETLN